MNLLDFFICAYNKLHNYHNIPIYVLTPFRVVVRSIANFMIPLWFNRTPSAESKGVKSDIIVSFTSFPVRIDNVWKVVECMLRQSLRPKKVILWLSKEQFPTTESIPVNLRERQNDIFEIRMVEDDIRSHKKYQYVCREFPDNPVVLIDDDIYYHTHFLKDLYNEFIIKHCVICYYCFLISYDSEGNILPYNTWKELECEKSDADNLFFGSGGGVLFRPSMLFKDTTNIDLALRLTPMADDIWLNAMVRLGHQKIVKIKSGLHLPITQKNNISLFSSNVSDGGNDVQISNIINYYGDVFNRVVL